MLCTLCLPISLPSNSLWNPRRPWTLKFLLPWLFKPHCRPTALCLAVFHYWNLRRHHHHCSHPQVLFTFLISLFFPFYLSKVSNTDLNLSVGSRGWANAASSPAQHSEHNPSDSNSAANMPARCHFRLLILSATVSGTWPFRDDLGLHKAYPAQYAYFIPLFHSYILSIKGPSLCGQSLESRIWYCWM